MTLSGPLTPGTDSVSSPVVPDATAVVAGQYMSIPSRPSRPCRLLWRRSRGPGKYLRPRTRFGSAAFWGSRPVFLDRIPSRMRTRVVAAVGGDTGQFMVRRAVVDLLRGDLRPVEPLRLRPRKDTTGAGGHGGANGHTGTLQDHSRRPGTPLTGGLGKKHAAIQSGHLLPLSVVRPTYGHVSSLGRPPLAGQLIFPGIFRRSRQKMGADASGGTRRPLARAAAACRARHAGRIPGDRAHPAAHRPARAASPRRQRFVTDGGCVTARSG